MCFDRDPPPPTLADGTSGRQPSSPQSSSSECMLRPDRVSFSPHDHGSRGSALNPSADPIQGPQPIPNLFALVIGVDKYEHHSGWLKNLTGAVADAKNVVTFLQETLGVPEERIKKLYDGQATKVTIETEIENLGTNDKIEKADPILIFYAGHGAEANAPPGWPCDNGKVEMLAPHDFDPQGSDNSKRGQGVLDIRLAHLLADLATKKSDNITVILDSCHSGSGTRADDDDPAFAVRGIDLPETYTIAQDLLHDIEPDARAGVAPAARENGPSSHVLLSACKARDRAWEKDGHGVFTSALLHFLKRTRFNNLSYKDVITNLPDLSRQDPQCEGVHRSRCIFDSKSAGLQRKYYQIRASSRLPPDQYVLEAGEANDVTEKARFLVFAKEASAFRALKISDLGTAQAEALGTVEVIQTKAFIATCKFSPPDNEPARPFVLAEASYGYAVQIKAGEARNVRISIQDDLNQKIKRSNDYQLIAEEMEKRSFCVVGSHEEPDLVLVADGDVVNFEIKDKVCQEYGLIRMPFTDKDKVKTHESATILHILRSSAHFYYHLLHSIKGSSGLEKKVTVERKKVKPSNVLFEGLQEYYELDPGATSVTIEDKGVIIDEEDKDASYGYEITNNTAVPVYVSLFYFDVSTMSIDLYYPQGSAKISVDAIPAGESLTIGYGESGTQPYGYTVPEGQDVDVGYLKLFVSTKYVDLSGIIQESVIEGCRKSIQRTSRIHHHECDTVCVAMVQKRAPKAKNTDAGGGKGPL